ncbi:hypothetical protein S2M10_11860 [Sphingomonas sp. S2M10]|uniref:BrnA antitoxin family protein n=1 Tax=Sphingomonas sp. S2M10 TaxID=2705010 RepID=UPI001456C026|nr:BrnA antitoxin family protein [Sphingomonas sp. S2M10]NLS26205.1 hypothetical protein [Sphingomonas sp. S2M10]
MTTPKFTQADMDAVSDNPEWTEADFAAARPFTEAFPELAAKMQRQRGPQKRPTKVSTTIRLSPDVIAYFKAGGDGWQSRIDEALKQWVTEHRA